jgi:hypothetical protein
MAKKISAGRKLSTVDAIISLAQTAAKVWPAVLAFFGGSGMSYLASLNPALTPLAWGFIGMATFLVLYVVLVGGVAAWSWALGRRAVARLSDHQLQTSTVNPLDPLLERKRVALRDFYHPFFAAHQGSHFRDCEIYGPGAVVLSGTQMFEECTFRSCDFIAVRPGAPINSAVAFDSPRFFRTTLFRVTFYLSPEDAQRMREALGPQIDFISENIGKVDASTERPL